ncbi:MAG: NAD(P)H-dependent oxidoreductase [Betaproteobacteria bacterium]|nr:MAG: NAD(P)H-dependent oxidoreductase [Betaproteobacteria bacterium]
MRVLTVYAHPNPGSFNHAILEQFTKGLTEAGHAPDIVDLYGIDFDPCVRLPDLAQFGGGQMPAGVVEQQQKVAGAEGIALIHPIWGWSFPAILKGWMDRVFSCGFAYEAGERGVRGLLKNRKTLVISTAGGPEEFYETAGYMDAFIKTCDGNSVSAESRSLSALACAVCKQSATTAEKNSCRKHIAWARSSSRGCPDRQLSHAHRS